nr:putative ribonuclease H-like domain-containing protein [Tanacetum cinerariifolium]
APVPTAGANTTNDTNSFNNVSPSATTVSPNFGIAEKSSFVDPSNYPDDPYMHEEGIDYDEVFASVGRIEAIRLFLAYASFIGFMVYQMDVKSSFLYGTIEKEVYVCQPPGFEDPDYPDKVYKVVKALYELHQAPRAWYANYLLENDFQRGKIDQTLFIKQQKGDILLVRVYVDDIIFGSTNKELCKDFEELMKDKFQMSLIGELTFFLGLQVKQKDDGIFISQDKYVAKILRKFSFTYVKSASTPIETEKPLHKDPDGEDVDVHIYMSMIGSLMYLTSFRPDIMVVVCACARFQVTPKVSHLHAVKRIFLYLKGKPYLGLWYLKDSLFNLVAYSDSDYAGASLDRKSTTRGCQFLAAASCCAQVLWIQNQLLDYGKELASPKQTDLGKDNSNLLIVDSLLKNIWLSMHHVIAMKHWLFQGKRQLLTMANLTFADIHNMIAFLSKSDASTGFDQIVDFLNGHVIQYAFLVNPTIYVACIKQFWASATIKKANGVVKLRPLIDGKRVIVTEDVIRQVLSFDDGDGWNVYQIKRFLLMQRGLPGTNSVVPWLRLSSALPQVESLIFLSAFLTAWLEMWIALASFSYMCYIVPTSCSLGIRQNCSSIGDSQTQEEGVKKLEKKRRSKSSGLKRLRKGRKNDDNAADKEVNAAEPTVFNDEEVTMTMAQTLIKMKAEIVRLLDEQMAKRLHDEEIKQAVAREKQEMDDLEKAKVLQKQYVDKQENIDWNVVVEQMQDKHLDNIRKYQSLKRKQISIAQARKNMIVYLKNMVRYKKEYFKGMTYDKESFKKLKAVKVSGSYSTQDTSTNDPKEMSEEDVNNMLEIVLVTKFKVEALQMKSSDEDFHEGQSTKEQKFGYILQVIKKLEFEKLDGLLAGVHAVQRLKEKALRD